MLAVLAAALLAMAGLGPGFEQGETAPFAITGSAASAVLIAVVLNRWHNRVALDAAVIAIAVRALSE